MQAIIEHEVDRKRKKNPYTSPNVITMLTFLVTKPTCLKKYKAQQGKYQQNLKCLRHLNGLSPTRTSVRLQIIYTTCIYYWTFRILLIYGNRWFGEDFEKHVLMNRCRINVTRASF